VRDLRAATVQFRHAPGDKAYNLGRIGAFSRQAARQGVELLAFPEMCICGYWHLRKLTREEMVGLALEARKNAYAPYSGFRVGAAVLADNGRVYTGCNIENASFGATMCAERTAIGKAISEGARQILTVAIASDSDENTVPCGICRQVMSEFCAHDMPLYLSDKNGSFKEYLFSDLLPNVFILRGKDDISRTMQGDDAP
jgi:cytidine deaminase